MAGESRETVEQTFGAKCSISRLTRQAGAQANPIDAYPATLFIGLAVA